MVRAGETKEGLALLESLLVGDPAQTIEVALELTARGDDAGLAALEALAASGAPEIRAAALPSLPKTADALVAGLADPVAANRVIAARALLR
jgi:hypothetical protein